MRAFLSVVAAAMAMAACGEDGTGGASDGGGVTDGGRMPMITEPTTFTHEFPAIDVAAGEERTGICQSWTLGNTEPLFVNAARGANGGSWHHSTWFYVSENLFRGPDGTWPCEDRGFTEIGTGVVGGVLLAQSTGASSDSHQFGPGVAIRLPPRARIVGDIHLVNASGADASTSMTLSLDVLPESQVTTRLLMSTFGYYDLEIPPRATSTFSMDCPIGAEYQRQLGRDPDFRIHFVQPHYHTLGNLTRITLVGGTRDGEVVFETHTPVGEPLGMLLSPPIDVAGAQALRITCGYTNDRDVAVGYGIGDQEMCVTNIYTDSTLRFGGTGDTNAVTGTTDGGVVTNESPCTLFAGPEL